MIVKINFPKATYLLEAKNPQNNQQQKPTLKL